MRPTPSSQASPGALPRDFLPAQAPDADLFISPLLKEGRQRASAVLHTVLNAVNAVSALEDEAAVWDDPKHGAMAQIHGWPRPEAARRELDAQLRQLQELPLPTFSSGAPLDERLACAESLLTLVSFLDRASSVASPAQVEQLTQRVEGYVQAEQLMILADAAFEANQALAGGAVIRLISWLFGTPDEGQAALRQLDVDGMAVALLQGGASITPSTLIGKGESQQAELFSLWKRATLDPSLLAATDPNVPPTSELVRGLLGLWRDDPAKASQAMCPSSQARLTWQERVRAGEEMIPESLHAALEALQPADVARVSELSQLEDGAGFLNDEQAQVSNAAREDLERMLKALDPSSPWVTSVRAKLTRSATMQQAHEARLLDAQQRVRTNPRCARAMVEVRRFREAFLARPPCDEGTRRLLVSSLLAHGCLELRGNAHDIWQAVDEHSRLSGNWHLAAVRFIRQSKDTHGHYDLVTGELWLKQIAHGSISFREAILHEFLHPFELQAPRAVRDAAQAWLREHPGAQLPDEYTRHRYPADPELVPSEVYTCAAQSFRSDATLLRQLALSDASRQQLTLLLGSLRPPQLSARS